MPSRAPLCFVLMPFGSKADPSRPDQQSIDFNAIYNEGIKPAIEDAGMSPARADEEQTIGVIHKPMFERLLLSEFAVADLTIPNPNVFYELGVRHASRANTTLPIFADHIHLPFDVALLRALPYKLRVDNGFGADEAAALRKSLGDRLKVLRKLSRESAAMDSAVFQMVTRSQHGNLRASAALRRIRDTDGSLYELLNRYTAHDKTDIFREVVEYDDHRKRELAAARQRQDQKDALVELNRIAADMQPLEETEAGAIVDLYLSYRAIEAWDEMIGFYGEMPQVLKRTVLVREQLAFALNRSAASDPPHPEYRERAISLLEEIVGEIGPSSETGGLLGRVYKDRWREAVIAGNTSEAHGQLVRAIEAYMLGFKADWRDTFPGINAATLLDIEGSPESIVSKDKIIPVVQFAVEQKVAAGNADYWDHATLLELAVLGNDEKAANERLAQALARVREVWEPKTTVGNLTNIYDARCQRGGEHGWLKAIIDELRKKAGTG